jgi:hypothetical protein
MEEDKPHFHDDDGTEVNPDLVPKPSLCLTCQKDDDPDEEILCALNRLDQRDADEFRCEAYQVKGSPPERKEPPITF